MISGTSFETSSIMNIDNQTKKMMNKKQLLSIEVSRKILKNIPGMMANGELLPEPSQKTLNKLHNSQKSLQLATNSPHRNHNSTHISQAQSNYMVFAPK